MTREQGCTSCINTSFTSPLGTSTICIANEQANGTNSLIKQLKPRLHSIRNGSKALNAYCHSRLSGVPCGLIRRHESIKPTYQQRVISKGRLIDRLWRYKRGASKGKQNSPLTKTVRKPMIVPPPAPHRCRPARSTPRIGGSAQQMQTGLFGPNGSAPLPGYRLQGWPNFSNFSNFSWHLQTLWKGAIDATSKKNSVSIHGFSMRAIG